MQRRSTQPIQQISVYLWADGFHKVTSQTVTSAGVIVQDTDSWIESERRQGQPRFRFQQSVEIIQHCIRRIYGNTEE
jgi:hypothetical protein